MNLKPIIWGLIALLGALWVGFLGNKLINYGERKAVESISKQISASVQKTMDARFNQFQTDIKKELQDGLQQRILDQKVAQSGNDLLNGIGNGWVPVQLPDQTVCETKTVGTGEHQRLTRTIRAELSAEFSARLKSESKRADQCAIDYNDLHNRATALNHQIIEYNKMISAFNAGFATKK